MKRQIIISPDIRRAVVDPICEYDTGTVGTSEEETVIQALFGSTPKEVVGTLNRTVSMARDERKSQPTLRETLVLRLFGCQE